MQRLKTLLFRPQNQHLKGATIIANEQKRNVTGHALDETLRSFGSFEKRSQILTLIVV